ncbi:DUF1254 domain-containing protein [Cereibacter sphaeroides]|uniref:DUF1254 domain-containing protein n=1 Tax=Cereibacter sphaeroides TaxID=1063 RepID=UPI001F337977|nr:DUF1254 domain-containing protein [Cereibacter sphaeroides]MCE6970539.1 DUF1254 domain-containing protein [Cereibacter sphaeroides]
MQHPARGLFAQAVQTSLIAALAAFAAAGPVRSDTAVAPAAAIADREASDIALEAYVYLYPLVTMEVTRRQLTNVEPGKGFGGPMNTFANIRAYPEATDRAVVRPNFDTLYSSAFLDLRSEPVVVSVPDTAGRYYLLPMLVMWSDVFASPGWRTTGTEAGHFVVVAKGWQPDRRASLIEDHGLPAETQVIEAPTSFVWIVGRTKTDGPADYAAVHAIQDGYALTPLSQWGRTPEPVAMTPDPAVDMKTPPKVQVDTMTSEAFFALGAELLKLHPPHPTDQPVIARMKRIGLEPGKSFDPESLDAPVRQAIARAASEGQRLMAAKARTLARSENGWQMNTDTMGVYGNYYLKRAIVAQVGLGANLPEDAVYPLGVADAAGQPLDGSHRYTMHFPPGNLPPAQAFWSVTLYDPDGFQVPNAINRFALSSWMPLEYNADGSLDLFIQNESPGKALEANWLPAPQGPFTLTMRLYAPRMDVLTGRWAPPPVEKATGTPMLAQ